MGKCTHVKQALRRHSTPGSLLLLLFAFIVFGPKAWDAAQGEPNVTNTLAIVTNSDGQVVVHDLTQTRNRVQGVRANVIETQDGSVICSTEHHNSWQGERNRFWRISAFTGCPVPNQPYRSAVPFRCSPTVAASGSSAHSVPRSRCLASSATAARSPRSDPRAPPDGAFSCLEPR